MRHTWPQDDPSIGLHAAQSPASIYRIILLIKYHFLRGVASSKQKRDWHGLRGLCCQNKSILNTSFLVGINSFHNLTIQLNMIFESCSNRQTARISNADFVHDFVQKNKLFFFFIANDQFFSFWRNLPSWCPQSRESIQHLPAWFGTLGIP